MKLFKIILKIVIAILLMVMVGFGSFLAWATLTDYKPDAVEILPVKGEGLPSAAMGDTISLLTWNIGYAGLGKEMDFFYEGGKRVRPTAEEYQRYLKGVLGSLEQADSPDFLFLQEVDRKARRSYYRDEISLIDSLFEGYSAVYASNYDVGFVPVPPAEPMGRVLAGLTTLSRYRQHDAMRVAFPSSYAWPKRLFMLDRCFILSHYKLAGGKELVLINTHNSAFDDAADMRKMELALLQKTMTDEFARGNYVIVGGDWNQNPLPFDPATITDGNKAHRITPPIPADFIPADWKWAFDPKKASNRDVNEPYQKGHTGTTIIDFFVLSPNLELLEVKTLPQGFLFSDHQAVQMKVRFRG
ncbi:MAG TPA: endonuclease/exonuclease/phosphatase family protein [Bacteroidales bacterium]